MAAGSLTPGSAGQRASHHHPRATAHAGHPEPGAWGRGHVHITAFWGCSVVLWQGLAHFHNGAGRRQALRRGRMSGFGHGSKADVTGFTGTRQRHQSAVRFRRAREALRARWPGPRSPGPRCPSCSGPSSAPAEPGWASVLPRPGLQNKGREVTLASGQGPLLAPAAGELHSAAWPGLLPPQPGVARAPLAQRMVLCRTWCMADTVFSQAVCREERHCAGPHAPSRQTWPSPRCHPQDGPAGSSRLGRFGSAGGQGP